MEIRFTASVIEAVDCVLQLKRGTFWAHPKDTTDPDDGTKVKPPAWCNCNFFSRIKASPIRRTERVEPTQERPGSWKLARTVEFFYHGSRVAAIDLVGQTIDGFHHEGLDNGSFWAVTRIGYFQYFSGGQHGSLEDWREIELEVTSLRGHLVA
ncbi:MAG: hypothetical protein WAP51_00035 [Candidatus Sungiibacteriota bacterium]